MKHRFKFVVRLTVLSVVSSGIVSGKQPRQTSISENSPRVAPSAPVDNVKIGRRSYIIVSIK